MNENTTYYKLKQTPHHIVFGDPMYFEDYADDKKRLKSLVTNLTLTKAQRNEFGCVVRLSCGKKEEKLPNGENFSYMEKIITILMCVPKDFDVYLSDLKYTNQTVKSKEIGVDSHTYYLQVNENDDEINTNADDCWGMESLYYGKINGKRVLQAVVINIALPDEMSEKEINQYMDYFFKEKEPYTFNPQTA